MVHVVSDLSQDLTNGAWPFGVNRYICRAWGN